MKNLNKVNSINSAAAEMHESEIIIDQGAMLANCEDYKEFLCYLDSSTERFEDDSYNSQKSTLL